MSKVCVVCGAELKSSLDEFGDFREPCCKSCWLAQDRTDSRESDARPQSLLPGD